MMIDSWGQLGSNVKWTVSPKKAEGGASAHAYLVDCTLNPGPRIDPLTSHAQIYVIEKCSYFWSA